MYKFVALLMLVSSALAYPVSQDSGSEYVLQRLDVMLLEIKKLVHEAFAPITIPKPEVPPSEDQVQSLPTAVIDVVETAVAEILESSNEPEVIPEAIQIAVEVPYQPLSESQEMKDFQEEMRLQAAEIVEDNTEFPVENDSDEKIAVKQIVEALPEYEIEELEEKTEAPAFVEVHPITNKPVIVEHIPEIQVVLDIATELQPPHEKLIVDSAPEAPINEIIVNDPISAVVLPVVLPEVATLPVEIPEKVVEPVKIPEKIVEPVKVPIVPTLPVKVPIVPAVTEKVPIVPAVPEKVSEVATLPVEIAEETVVPTKSPQDVIPPAPVKQTVKRVKNQNKIKKFVQKKTPVV